jgi:hypothetical protein
MAALCAGAPTVYSYLTVNIDFIRNNSDGDPMARSINSASADTTQQKVRDSIVAAVEEEAIKGGVDAQAAAALFAEILPAATSPNYAADQRVHVRHPRDYWRRAVSEDLGPGVSDQQFLSALQQWKSAGDDAFSVRLVQEDDWAEKLEQFSSLLPDDSIHPLATEVFRLGLAQQGSVASHMTVRAFSPLWRMALNGRTKQDKYCFVVTEFERSLTSSLRFATDVAYYFGAARPEVGMLSHKEGVRFSNQRRISARRLLKDDAILRNSIGAASPATLARFVFLENGGHNPRWRWLARLALDGAEKDAALMAPQLCYLVAKTKHSISPLDIGTLKSVSLDDDVINVLWPKASDRERLWKCLAQAPDNRNEETSELSEAWDTVARVKELGFARSQS